jgi:mevalonate kinase
MNQKLLELMGVSHPALETVCNISKHFGASSKLTGAGGGGCALTLLPPSNPHHTFSSQPSTHLLFTVALSESELMQLREALQQQGFTSFCTEIGVPGVGFREHFSAKNGKRFFEMTPLDFEELNFTFF